MTAIVSLRPVRRAKVVGTVCAGQRFGRLTAVRYSGLLNCEHVWRFRCDCGVELDRIVSLVRRAWMRGITPPSCLDCNGQRRHKKNLPSSEAFLRATPEHVATRGR